VATFDLSSSSICIITIPGADEEFARRVDANLRDLDADADAAMSTHLTRLRTMYPRVTMRRKSPLATFGDDETTWYVYRDSDAPVPVIGSNAAGIGQSALTGARAG